VTVVVEVVVADAAEDMFVDIAEVVIAKLIEDVDMFVDMVEVVEELDMLVLDESEFVELNEDVGRLVLLFEL
jgi:hypothetical protein